MMNKLERLSHVYFFQFYNNALFFFKFTASKMHGYGVYTNY